MLTYLRTARAATPASDADDNHQHAARRPLAAARASVQTLWASRPLSLGGGGRLVAVRLRGDDVEVGWATDDGLRWVRPDRVISEAQAQAWVRTSRFARHDGVQKR